MSWVKYFDAMASRGYNMQDLFSVGLVDEDDEGDFEEDIEEDIEQDQTPSTNKKKKRIGFSSVYEHWKKLGEEKKSKSLILFNMFAPASKNGKNKAAPGSQQHSERSKRSIAVVVDLLKGLFGDEIDFAIQALSLNDEFRTSILMTNEEANNKYIEELSLLKNELTTLKSDLDNVQQKYRENLEIFYNSSNISINELDKLFQLMRNLISNRSLAEKIVPRSKSTLNRDIEKLGLNVPSTANEYATTTTIPSRTLDPIFITSVQGKLDLSLKSTIKSQLPKKPKKKKFLTPKQKEKKKKRKEKLKRIKEEKEKKNMEALKKFEKIKVVMDDINKQVQLLKRYWLVWTTSTTSAVGFFILSLV